MVRRDEKGYVLSGLGFLLLIPVMMLIPIALSAESQSAGLPDAFVKTDNDFQTFQNIYSNLNDKINDFQNTQQNTSYLFYNYSGSNPNGPGVFAGRIYTLYNATAFSYYTNTFLHNGNPGTVDTLNLKQENPAKSNHLSNMNDYNVGQIPLNNGIEIDYALVNINQAVSVKNKNQNVIYYYALYNMTIIVSMTVDITKNNTAIHKNIYAVYGPIPFYVNATPNGNGNNNPNINVLQGNLGNFFIKAQGKDSSVKDYLTSYGICNL